MRAPSEMRIGRILLACGVLGLGAGGALFGEFVAGLQPVPASLADSHLLAALSGLILLIGGGLLLIDRYVAQGALVIATFVGAWVLLQIPGLTANYAVLAAWLGAAEAAAIAAGALLLALVTRGGVRVNGMSRARLARGVEISFAATLLVFGACHFVYDDFTAAMVPAWIPGRLFWAWATGVAHIAAGLAIIGDVKARLAATLLGVMFGSWAVLVHVPLIASAPSESGGWKLLFVTLALTGSALVVAAAIIHRRRDKPAPVAEPHWAGTDRGALEGGR